MNIDHKLLLIKNIYLEYSTKRKYDQISVVDANSDINKSIRYEEDDNSVETAKDICKEFKKIYSEVAERFIKYAELRFNGSDELFTTYYVQIMNHFQGRLGWKFLFVILRDHRRNIYAFHEDIESLKSITIDDKTMLIYGKYVKVDLECDLSDQDRRYTQIFDMSRDF